MASTIPIEPVNGVTKAEDKSLNLDSLKAHVSRESLWMLLHDKVYDVTKFMDEHPGGDEVLMEEAGRDATEAFEDVGHSDEARGMLPKMLMGEFTGEKTDKSKKTVTPSATALSSSSSK
ncbi:MAG: hypothetical protein TREMPRED_002675 [Tremellales sp. Tagirdzhanova-0007]|nr:MAG: hypothetical protein TREMPRED_002675 [Tremellales sp. Tagirdzhanova-0007]